MNDIHNSRSWTMIVLAAAILLLGALAGCGGGEPEGHDESDHSADSGEEMSTDSSAPRVFFANVQEGDSVTSPVHLEFGIENYEIVAAVDPPVIEEGKGHHHLGINTHCLPAGEVIVKADPWVHFGDGSASIDVQLPPGPAHLALQVGDGEHRTLDEDGLCAMINLNVVEETATEEEGE